MLIIGLTGGIASGKSFVEKIFLQEKIPVFDADREVHKLISSSKEIFLQITQNFPKAIVNDKIDRKSLGLEVFGNKEKLEKLEKIIYPFLHKAEDNFIKQNQRSRKKIVVLNIPLLFEKGGDERCDLTIAVVAPKAIRFNRFKQRFKDTDLQRLKEKFNQINSHQTTDQIRKIKADFVIHNSLSKAFCYRQTKLVIKTICNLQTPSL